jgi:hypothetical protein
VDINPRAASCTNFNIQASGATNVEVVVGDLYEPVRGERFDLIMANPPFVPSPVNSLRFRDGGQTGEDVQRRIVAGLPFHLAPGGIAQIVTELGESDDVTISARLRDWLGGAPLDILILRLRVHPITDYAVQHADGDYDYGAFIDSVHDWAGNLKMQGYSRVVSVLLTFQWSDPEFGPPWTRSLETPPPLGDAGSEVESMFSVERMVRRPDLYEILESSRVRRAESIWLMEAQMLGGNLREQAQTQLSGKALPVIQKLDPIEREVLLLMNEPLELPDLVMRGREHNLSEVAVFSAVGSLLWKGLVILDRTEHWKAIIP